VYSLALFLSGCALHGPNAAHVKCGPPEDGWAQLTAPPSQAPLLRQIRDHAYGPLQKTPEQWFSAPGDSFTLCLSPNDRPYPDWYLFSPSGATWSVEEKTIVIDH
jgi:hypothetical protein